MSRQDLELNTISDQYYDLDTSEDSYSFYKELDRINESEQEAQKELDGLYYYKLINNK